MSCMALTFCGMRQLAEVQDMPWSTSESVYESGVRGTDDRVLFVGDDDRRDDECFDEVGEILDHPASST